MKDKKEKPSPEMTDDEKIESKKESAKYAVADDRVYGDKVQIILLMDSVDKLKVSVEKGTESSNKLTEITNTLTEKTNKLTDKIRTMTKVLVFIGIIALTIGLGGVILQLIILLCRN